MADVPLSDEEVLFRQPYNPVYNIFPGIDPIVIDQRQVHSSSPNGVKNLVSLHTPLHAPLLFYNEQSEVRDFCANERTLLSWLRLATYLAIVSIALIVSFDLKGKPTRQEQRVGLPLGLAFWVLSLATLVCGMISYLRNVEGYGRRKALVQSGWAIQSFFALVAIVIIGVCILFIATNAETKK